MPDQVDWELLYRYATGTCTDEERTRLERWAAADPERGALVDVAARLIEQSDELTQTFDVDAAVARLRRDVTDVVEPAPRPAPRRTPPAPRRPIIAPRRARHFSPALRAAAVVLVMASAALLWRPLSAVMNQPPTPAMREWATGTGQRTTFRLADGTRVTLATNSRLRSATAADAKKRDVYLDGEGYFEVSHDAARPFTVHAGDAVVRDIGTAFGVRAYAGDSSVQVVVAEGEVALRPARAGAAPGADRADGATLTRGQLGRLTKGAPAAIVENVDLDAYLGWTQGRLVFKRTPLREVVSQLGRWYDVEFELADSALAARRFTGAFEGESLAEVLELMAPSLELRYERRGRTVVLRPRDSER